MNRIQNSSTSKNSEAKLKLPKPHRKAQAIDFKLKYKTELCKNYAVGVCEYGSSCAFAHGEDELRRARDCYQYRLTGSCTYRSSCQFLHIEDSASTTTSVSSSRKNSIDDQRPRLPVFIALENSLNS